MPWFKVDDGFYSSRKVLSIPRSSRLAAVGLWTLAGNWSARALTDGVVPAYVLAELGATPRLRQVLVTARLWLDHAEGGIEFHAWTEYQPTRDQVEAERKAGRQRQQKSRERRRQGANGHGDVTRDSHRDSRVTDASVTDVSQRPDPTRPDPTPESASHSPSQPSAAVLSKAFDEAYMAWPKKVERKDAHERFKAAAKKRSMDELLDDVKRFGAAYAATTERKFIPALGVWLNRERWTDELPTGAAAASQPPKPMKQRVTADTPYEHEAIRD